MSTKRKVLFNLSHMGNLGIIPPFIWVPTAVILSLLYILYSSRIDLFLPSTYIEDNLQEEELFYQGYLVRTEVCKIADMNPLDETVAEFIQKPHRPVCADGKLPLFEANKTSIFLVKSSLQSYYLDKSDDVLCCYRSFWRVPPRGNQYDNQVQYSDNCHFIKESENISDEFIVLNCLHGDQIVYTDYFAFVPIKDSINSRRSLPDNEGNFPLNILLVGLDAVSRINLHRQMWKTTEYLRNISAVELLGFNKVGYNTFPNIIPVLTGFSADELRNVCWPNNDARFDKCPFIWNKFKEEGYVTAFGEDASWMGIFNYLRKGFEQQPTDYMWGVFNREAENNIGNKHKLNMNHCIGSREAYKTFLDYIKKFIDTMHDASKKYFAFFWSSSLTHDYLNMPMLGDDDYYHFFKYLKDSGQLEKTAVFFLSDHGMRWGAIRKTYQGSMEERLPFLYVLLPDWFKRKHFLAYRNLLRNNRRLTTHFDIHETLLDLLKFNETEATVSDPIEKRGHSLFESIPTWRTCRDAGIVTHWCACQVSYRIDVNTSLVQRLAKFITDRMNSELNDYQQCARLKLSSISEARQIVTTEKNFQDYSVTIETKPGRGLFEATIRYYASRNDYLELIGTISRLNLYRKQSSCIDDFQLKLYCYCKSLLSRLFQYS